jgi:demethylmenaquinone methyltransferase/2-methoxy-6-polyprenyl-1,4-benzoquinol methylase
MTINTEKEKIDERASFVKHFFKDSGSIYDFIVNLTTLGMDNLWKRNIIHEMKKHKANTPLKILDLACGTGIVTYKIARAFPNAQIVGVDITQEYLDIAQWRLKKSEAHRIKFFNMNAEDMGSDFVQAYRDQFDIIVTSYLPKYVNLELVINTCDSLFKSHGLLVFHDFTTPREPLLRRGYRLYWGIMRPFLQIIWSQAAKLLEDVVQESPWVEDICQTLENHHYENISIKWQPLQIAAIVIASK